MLFYLACTFVLVDEPCDTGVDSAVDTDVRETGSPDTDDSADTSPETGETGRETGETGEKGHTGDTGRIDADGDGFSVDEDCDDTRADVNPDEDEVCDDRVDNDCDGTSNDCAPTGTAALADSARLVAHGGQADAYAGAWVGSAGDQDGDGLPDLLISEVSSTFEGAVFLATGTASGSATLGRELGTRVEHHELFAGLAAWAGGVGDVDGDGWTDLLLGAPGDHRGQAGSFGLDTGPNEDAGEAWLLLGPLSATSGDVTKVGDARVLGEEAGAHFGFSASSGTTGSGSRHVAIGAPSADTDLGAAYVFDTLTGDVGSDDALFSASGQTQNGFLGGRLALAELDGDGLLDLVVGAPGWIHDIGDLQSKQVAGEVFVFLGEPTGAWSVKDADWTLTGTDDTDNLGSELTLGDHDADGHLDLAVGAAGTGGKTGEGAVYLLQGPITSATTTSDAVATWSGEAGWGIGLALDLDGDVDGDGRSDLLLGTHRPDDDAGRAFLELGPLSGSRDLSKARATWTGSDAERAGLVVRHAGDTDGDGDGDIAVGAPYHGSRLDQGGATYLLDGSGL